MKKVFVLFLVALFFLSAFSYSSAEQKFPKGSFFLFGGRIKPKVVSPVSDPRVIALKTAMASMTVTVRDGVVEGDADVPVDFTDKNVFADDPTKILTISSLARLISSLAGIMTAILAFLGAPLRSMQR